MQLMSTTVAVRIAFAFARTFHHQLGRSHAEQYYLPTTGELADQPLVDVVAPVFSEITGLSISVTVDQVTFEAPNSKSQQVFLPR